MHELLHWIFSEPTMREKKKNTRITIHTGIDVEAPLSTMNYQLTI